MKTILEVKNEVFSRWFKGNSWESWDVVLAALFGLPMTPEQTEIFRRHTGRTTPPTKPAREGWIIAGRRGGKSRIAALIAVYLACFKRYSHLLAPGEVATVMVLAADRRQARTVFRYVRALLEVPMLAKLIVNETKESIELSNRVAIEIHVSSYRSVRGYSAAAVICDEVAFWPVDADSALSDSETVNALRPALVTTGGLLLGISTPYSRRGVLWEQYRKHHGIDGSPVLTWQASSREMNPKLPAGVVEQALESDEASARAEYLAEFRSDLEQFISRELLDAATIPNRRSLPPVSGVTSYRAFIDAAGGSGSDSMAMAIGHGERDGKVVLDLIVEKRPPFSPASTVSEFSSVLKEYHLASATADRYAAEWVTEKFSECGVRLNRAGKSKSELYLEFLPVLTSGQCELLDHPRLAGQLLGLERRTSRMGRDLVDHGVGQHDDLANVASGALVLAKPARYLNATPVSVGVRVSPWREMETR